MFKGQFKLIKKDINTGLVTYETDWLDNNVTLAHIQGRMHVNATSSTARIGPNIVICEWDGPVDEIVNDLVDPWLVGANVTSPTFNGNPNVGTPYFEEYQQTFSPPTLFYVISGQDETNYDSSPVTEGSFTGGSGYAVGDYITLNSSTVVEVDTEAAGVVTGFTIQKRGFTSVTAGVALTQSFTDGSGTSFTLTPEADNITQTRFLNSIGVTDNSISGSGIEVDAWTALGATCTQTSIETLIVFYRVQFDAKSGNRFNTSRQSDVALFYGHQSLARTFPIEAVHGWQPNLHHIESGLYVPGVSGSGLLYAAHRDAVWSQTSPANEEVGPEATFNQQYFAKRFTHETTIAQTGTIGQIRGSILYKSNISNNFGRVAWWNNLLPPGAGKVQNIYSHASGREATEIDFTGHTIVGGDHWTIDSPAASYYVWYTVDAGGADPAPGGTGIQVDILSGDTDTQAAQKTQAVLAANLDFDCATTTTAVINVINHVGGTVTDAADVNAGVAVTVLIQGSATFATVPFFDPLTVPTTTGVIAVDSSSWTDPDYQFLYRINITESGILTNSTYNFQRRRQTAGFVGNTYLSSPEAFTMLTNINNAALGSLTDNDSTSAWLSNQSDGGSSSDRGETPHRYDDRTIFVCDNSKMAFVDVITGELKLVVQTADFGAWVPTNIGQYEYDEVSDTVWVACDQTGIYSVNDPLGSPVVSFHDVTGATYTGSATGPTNEALAIDCGHNLGSFRKIWAVVQGALVTSIDNGSTWTAYDGTNANGALVGSQDETDYNGAITDSDTSATAGRGHFAGGTGYAIADTITLSHDGSSVITVDNVSTGVVTEFTITTPTATTVPERIPLTQTGSSGGGTGFELTPDHHNVTTTKFRNAYIGTSLRLGANETNFDASFAWEGTFTGGNNYATSDKIVLSDGSVWNVASQSGGVVTQFDILKTGGTDVGGVTLTQVYTTGIGTGFTVTPSATYNNGANLGLWRHVIGMRVSRVETDGKMFLWHYLGSFQSSTHKIGGTWWDDDLGYQDMLGGHSPTSDGEYFFSVFSNASGTGFTNQRRLWHRMHGISPNDDRFAVVTASTTFAAITRNNVPIWMTYRQGEGGFTDHDSGLANGGRAPALTFNEDPTVTSGGTARNQNHLEFGTNDSGEDFIWFINEGEQDLFALEQSGVATKISEISSYPTGTGEAWNSTTASDGFMLYMGKGIFLMYNNTRSTFSSTENNAVLGMFVGQGNQPLGPFKVDGSSNAFEQELWESYGWNGAAWVLNHDGVKATHASSDTLIDGLTISFDDDSGADTFVITDYFTLGVINGVQLDSNTEYDWAGSLYLQPTEVVTAMEPAAVPGSTSLVNTPTNAPTGRLSDYADTTGNMVLTQGGVGPLFDDINKTGTAGVEGTRLNQPSEGDFNLIVDHFTTTQAGSGDGTIFGVSNVTVLGNALVRDNVQFGFYILGDTTAVNIYIRESGVNVAVAELGLNQGVFGQGLNMRIERVGSTINYYFMEKLVHTSASPFSADAVPEFIIGNGADARLVMRNWDHEWTDTWSYVGTSGGTSGHYDPLLRTVDPQAQDYSLTINAVEGVTIAADEAGRRDRNTVLSSGEYVLFPETGAVRLAAADSALALAGNFLIVQSD